MFSPVTSRHHSRANWTRKECIEHTGSMYVDLIYRALLGAICHYVPWRMGRSPQSAIVFMVSAESGGGAMVRRRGRSENEVFGSLGAPKRQARPPARTDHQRKILIRFSVYSFAFDEVLSSSF